MDWKDLEEAVGRFAPTLGTLVGGPAGAVVGSLIASTLGTGGTPDEVSQALISNPDAAVKLKQIEADRQVELQKLATSVELQRITSDVDDRQGARKREVDTKDTFTPRALAIGVTVGFFGVLGWLLVEGKPSLGGDALLVMLGSLGTAWAAIVNYYFGSSASSQTANATLHTALLGKAA